MIVVIAWFECLATVIASITKTFAWLGLALVREATVEKFLVHIHAAVTPEIRHVFQQVSVVVDGNLGTTPE